MNDLKNKLVAVSLKARQPLIRNNDKYQKELANLYPLARSIKEQIYLLLNDYITIPLCANANCSNLVNFLENRYTLTCCKKCSVQYQKQSGIMLGKKDKHDSTCMVKYGTTHQMKCETTKEKIRKTCIEKYGCDNPLKNKKVKEKQQLTISLHSAEEIEKSSCLRKKTNLEIYGTELPAQNLDIKNKIKETNLEKYGVDCVFKSEKIKNKIKETNLEKYGVEYISQNEDIKNKIRTSNIKTFYDSLPIRNISTNVLPNFDITEYKGNKSIHSWICNNCKFTFVDHMEDGKIPRCPVCFPSELSNPEKEVFDYIKSLDSNLELIRRNRLIIKPMELDIFIPANNIAIEFNGLYWHNESHISDKGYHSKKLFRCISSGVKLISIFEDEWAYKKDIVKSILSNSLGFSSCRIYARKCGVKKISNQEANAFLKLTHLMSHGNNKQCFGLFYNQELVSVMTFTNKNLSRKSSTWEINRFASKLNYSIPGGASKLFNAFVKEVNPEKVISFADRRYGEGKVYERLGFKFLYNTGPNYWYIVGKKRYHRFTFRKNSHDDKLKTEWQNRKDQGFSRIWDCGSAKWEWINPKLTNTIT